MTEMEKIERDIEEKHNISLKDVGTKSLLFSSDDEEESDDIRWAVQDQKRIDGKRKGEL